MILFDLTAIQPNNIAKFHGGGYYGEMIFFALAKKTKDIVAVYNKNLYINPKVFEKGIKIYNINEISPLEIVKKEQVDIFYTPLYKSRKEWQFYVDRYVMTWHGVRWLEMPSDNIEVYYSATLKQKFNYILRWIRTEVHKHFYSKMANVINAEYITDSEHSKNSIISFFPQLVDCNIPVLYPPMDSDITEPSLESKFKPKSYFLLTSSSRWVKNNLRAVWAFDELFSQRRDIDFKVILTGVTNKNIFEKRIKNKSRFEFLKFVDRGDLLSLYKNAYAFIYPSLNEGFGYPPLESMQFGVPVAASGTSSIPEICQNAAIYFDPYNITEIKNRIIQLLDKNIYEEYSKRALKRYKVISKRQKIDLEKIVNFILLGSKNI